MKGLVGFAGQASVCLLFLGGPGMADVWSLLQIHDSVPYLWNSISTSPTILSFILFSFFWRWFRVVLLIFFFFKVSSCAVLWVQDSSCFSDFPPMSPQPCLGHSQAWQSRAELLVKGITPCPPLGLPCSSSRNYQAGSPWGAMGWQPHSSSLKAHSIPIADFLAHIITTVQGFITHSNIQHGKIVSCQTIAAFVLIILFWQCRREEQGKR